MFLREKKSPFRIFCDSESIGIRIVCQDVDRLSLDAVFDVFGVLGVVLLHRRHGQVQRGLPLLRVRERNGGKRRIRV
jgi:hypothetical protein